MNHSDELDQIAAALVAIQAAVPNIPKDALNPFFKSKYADLPAVMETATPVVTANGVAVIQTIGHDGGHDTLTNLVVHVSGQWIADTMRLHLVKDDPQGQGSAITYARRYSYMAALGLVADEDDDGQRASKPARKAAARPSTANLVVDARAAKNRIYSAFRDSGLGHEAATAAAESAWISGEASISEPDLAKLIAALEIDPGRPFKEGDAA